MSVKIKNVLYPDQGMYPLGNSKKVSINIKMEQTVVKGRIELFLLFFTKLSFKIIKDFSSYHFWV